PRASLTRRASGLVFHAFPHFTRDKGSAVAAFKDNRVTRHKCWDDMAVGKMSGKIERTEHSGHAVRLMACIKILRYLTLGSPFPKRFDRNFDFGDHGRDFLSRFP